MSHRGLALLLLAGSICTLLWRHELFTVQRPGDLPRDLASIAIERRGAVSGDAVLPAVPIGMRRLRAGDEAVLVTFWAPWQQGGLAQATALDSLRRSPGLETPRIEVVCFDPFPSVARYIGRHRLALPVLLDTRGQLRAQLPCPSIPYTYVLDGEGRVAVSQPGRVEWLSPGTRRTLLGVLRETPPPMPPRATPLPA